MLSLRKSAIVISIFGSSVVFSGTMGAVCSPTNAAIPSPSTACEFGAQALYFQPALGAKNLDHVQIQEDGSAHYGNFDPTYAWGFKVEGSYHFNTGNDLNLNWYRLQNSTTISATDVFAVQSPGVTPVSGTGIIDPSWNAVNLEFGQRIDFGDMKVIRVHGGVAYARVAIDKTLITANLNPVTVAEEDSAYNGFGPRVGADMAYGWGHGLEMYINAATALLVGTQGFNNTSNTSPARIGSTAAVVPELEAKLGATYTHVMAQGDLSLNVGWMWINYFQVNLTETFIAGVPGTLGAEANNIAFQGPFMGLKWIGNVG